MVLEAEQTPGWHCPAPFLCCPFLRGHSSPLHSGAAITPCLLSIKRGMPYCSFLMNLQVTKPHSAAFVRHPTSAEIQVDTQCYSSPHWQDLQPTRVRSHLRNRGHGLYSAIQRGCDSFLWRWEMLLVLG